MSSVSGHRNSTALLLLVLVACAIMGFAFGTNDGAYSKAASSSLTDSSSLKGPDPEAAVLSRFREANPKAFGSSLPRQSDEKVVERTTFPNEPFEFGDLSVRKTKVSPGQRFSAISLSEKAGGRVEDWLENLSFTLRNTSKRRMTYINVELDFPETVSNGPLMVYNHLGIGIHPKASGDMLKNAVPLALEPGGNVTLSFSAQHLSAIKEFLALRNFQLADLNQAVVRIDYVIFEGGTKWSQGDDYKPNPAERSGYERISPTVQ